MRHIVPEKIMACVLCGTWQTSNIVASSILHR
jgi:hypothetical protein